MGANEKHAATYHGGAYTPDYQYVKTIFAMNAKTPVSGGHPDTLWEERTEQFDRWLETVRAEAKAEALEEAADALTREEVPDGWGIPTYENYGNWLRARANQYKESQK